MSWTPIGPGFVFGPRALPFKRISARNEYALQGLVAGISVSPLDAQRIYVVSYHDKNESAAFATIDGGTTWRAISDALRNADPAIAPSCVAAHPTRSQSLFLGTNVEGRVHVSDDGGGTWSWSSNAIGDVRAILVDPRMSGTLATTQVYAATSLGIYFSSDGAQNFTQVQAGDAWSIVGYFPSAGTPHLYATVWERGIYHATTSSSWQLLNGLSGTSLPASTTTGGSLDFQGGFVDYCPRNPGRVYVWLFHGTLNTITSAGLFVSDGTSPLNPWTNLPVGGTPNPLLGYYGYYAGAFAVAPNSPGDGANDILLFFGFEMSRSINSGALWAQFPYGNPLHPDGHAIDFFPDKHAYYPEVLGGGVPPIPDVYAGTDGGLELCRGYADPAFAFGTAPTLFNEGDSYDPNLRVPQNLNQGRFCNRLNRANFVLGYPALGYIGSTDTGVAAGGAAPGWRAVYSSDSGIVAAAPGASGMTVWTTGGSQDGTYYWTGYYLQTIIDSGVTAFFGATKCALPGGIDDLVGTSNLAVGLDGKCLTGLYSREPLTTIPGGVAMPGTQAVTPASMAEINMGTILWLVWPGAGHLRRISVDSITTTTFTANIPVSVPPGTAIHIERAGVGRIDSASAATHISQIFGQWASRVYCVAFHPTDPNVLYCATADQRVWTTNSGSTAGPSTVWTEIAGSRPGALATAVMPYESTSSTWTGIRERATTPVLCAVAVDAGGHAFALLSDAVPAGGMTTPVFQLTGGNWVPIACSGLPDLVEGEIFSSFAPHPTLANAFYATRGPRVFALSFSGGAFTATELTENLPGSSIHDIYAVNVTSPGDSPRVFLRAATAIRGQWEREVTTGATTPAHLLYLRDNRLDTRWFGHCPDYAPDPYSPGHFVYHWHCEDIKVEILSAGHYQSDPEATPAMSATQFDVLQNNSEAIPPGAVARVHVRVQNGGTATASGVNVWVLWCKPAGSVPLLNTSPSMGDMFLFWGQFSGGSITNLLPGDSPWHQVAPPSGALPDIPPGESRVASFNWMAPTLGLGDDGHYCLAAFVTSPDLPLSDSSYSVDEIVVRAKQVGQKNVHIGTAGGMGGGMAAGETEVSTVMLEQIDLHGVARSDEAAAMEIDLSALPPQIEVTFRLGRNIRPVSITGAKKIRPPSIWRELLAALLRIIGALIEAIGLGFESVARNILGEDFFRRPPKPPERERKPDFAATHWTAAGGSLVAVSGFKIKSHDSAPVQLAVRLRGNLAAGSEHSFDVRQFDGKRLVGGSTYVIRAAAGKRRILRPAPLPEDHSDID